MPYVSEKQRRFMYANHPDIAAKWEAEGKNYIKKSFKDHMKKMMQKGK